METEGRGPDPLAFWSFFPRVAVYIDRQHFGTRRCRAQGTLWTELARDPLVHFYPELAK